MSPFEADNGKQNYILSWLMMLVPLRSMMTVVITDMMGVCADTGRHRAFHALMYHPHPDGPSVSLRGTAPAPKTPPNLPNRKHLNTATPPPPPPHPQKKISVL